MTENKKRRIAISALIVLMLAGGIYGAVTVTTGPYTGCVTTASSAKMANGTFYNMQSGLSPSNPCRINDIQISLYEKTYIDKALAYLQYQINSLSSRVTNLENQNTYVAGDYAGVYENFTPSSNTMKTIATYQFYLPEDSYVYYQSSGSIETDKGIWVAMGMDGNPCPGGCYVDKLRGLPAGPYVGFEMSDAGSASVLTKGYHTIYFDAGWSPSTYANWLNLQFNVISARKTLSGTTTINTGGFSTTSKEKIPKAIYKDGKITIEK